MPHFILLSEYVFDILVIVLFLFVCRSLGNQVSVTWYNKDKSYLPSQTDGDFTLELSLDMEISSVITKLAAHLNTESGQLLIHTAKR